MGIQALYTAATGMKAMDLKLDVVANNLANISTVGFKRSRVNFEDIMYRILDEPGGRNGLDQPVPTGMQVGFGVQTSGTQQEFEQGAVEQTGETYDMMIEGDGFFQVQAVLNGQEQTLYTRAGNFTLNANGEMVLANSIGARLEPAITVPQDAINVTISPNGQVLVKTQGSNELSEIGQIQLARFINNVGLLQLGKNLFQFTDASGQPIVDNPLQNGLGGIQQGSLELSNTDPVKELVGLIQTQRAFELNSQSIQSADQTLQTISNLRRF